MISMTDSQQGVDRVIEAYKRSVDRTLIRENLKRSFEDRLLGLQALQQWADELRAAGESERRRRG